MYEQARSEQARFDLSRLAARLGELTTDPHLAGRVADVAEGLEREAAPSERALDRMRTVFGLSAFERDLLVLVGLPEEHEALTTLARTLNPRGEPHTCLAAVAAALRLDDVGCHHLRSALEAGPLHEHRIVQVDALVPFPEAGIRLAPGLWSVLRGHDHWPADVPTLTVAPLVSPALGSERLHAALGQGRRVVVVTGGDSRPPSELAAVVRGAAQAGGTQVVTVAADALDGPVAALVSVHAAVRGAIPVVVGRPTHAPLPTHPGPVLVCADDMTGLALDDRPVVVVELADRDLGESVRMWQGLVPDLNGGADHLASVLRVDQVRATRAVADARATTGSGGGPISVAAIVGHARRRTHSDLPPSARLVRPRASWDDLVTTPDNAEMLRSVVDRVRGQVRVLHDWGFGAHGGPGVRALFAGPPGTGKTLSAHVVAGDLDLDLLVVDVSALVSKWIGETEKHISEVFAAAERSQAVLFFDEADAIFGKRTDGNDAQARWANLETAHLLAKIDEFAGLVVLATNLRGHIDDAFVRRLDVVVEFDEPGVEERRRLWSTHLSPRAPLAADVDLEQLASIYQVTGGLIRNAALAAAYRAAATDRCIDQRTLLGAVEREYQKAGRSFPGIPRSAAVVASGGT
ncbi:MAG: AAA family ATPase [Acidimicrobiia bacterium]|nr:AAA family ATPase [Acidimicrobiia bacterium]